MLEVTVPSMHTEAAVDVMIKEEPIDIHMETVGALRGTDACVKKETVHHEGDVDVIPESSLQVEQLGFTSNFECQLDTKIQTYNTTDQPYIYKEEMIVLECKEELEESIVTEEVGFEEIPLEQSDIPKQIKNGPTPLIEPPKEMLEISVPSMHTEAAVEVMIKEEPIDIHMETVGALRGTDACVKKETVHQECDVNVIPDGNLQVAQSECINDFECQIDRKIQTHKTVGQQYRCEEQKVLQEECKEFEESNTVTEDCNEIDSLKSASILKKITRFRNQEVDDIPKVRAKTAVERMRAYRARRREMAGADRRYGDPELERSAKTAAERMRAYGERKRALNNGTVERLNDTSHSLEDRVVPEGMSIRKSTEFHINQYGHVGSTNGEHPPHVNEATPLAEPPKEMVVTVPSVHTEGPVDVMIKEEPLNNNLLTKKVAKTSTERVREYRTRIRALVNTRYVPPSNIKSTESKKNLEYKIVPENHLVRRKPKTPTERVHAHREKKRAMNVNERLIGTNRSHNRN
ncbi:uncharacterized protein [Epargyreus clarus]|uniref:uncharacterized protein n=1 Tax=Epargyreus clarus TaxID=520877 RepID=UPI003C30D3D6